MGIFNYNGIANCLDATPGTGETNTLKIATVGYVQTKIGEINVTGNCATGQTGSAASTSSTSTTSSTSSTGSNTCDCSTSGTSTSSN